MTEARMVRLAEPADLVHLHAIERASSALFPPGRIPDVDDVMPIDRLAMAIDEGSLVVAVSQGSVVGFAMAELQDEGFHLAVMAVHPAHGRLGLGRQLVAAIIQEASRRNLANLTLTTFADLPFNGPFYRSAGFCQLADEELSPTLRRILATEGRLGMVNRVAMRHALGTAAT
jgi:GNAT superfamily N-acetyltransferase